MYLEVPSSCIFIFMAYKFIENTYKRMEEITMSLLVDLFIYLYVWCTKRVKSTVTGRPVFQKYGSTRKNTGRPVNLRVDPYFRYGSTRIFAGRPVNIRVDPYFYGSTRIIRVDPCFCGSTRIFTGRPVFYGSTCIYGSTRVFAGRPAYLRVDP